jgi:phosphoglycerol transferase MdoB-like AlkP superfamily enzyme
MTIKKIISLAYSYFLIFIVLTYFSIFYLADVIYIDWKWISVPFMLIYNFFWALLVLAFILLPGITLRFFFFKNETLKKIKTVGICAFIVFLTFPNFLFYEYYQGPPNLTVTSQALDIEFLRTVAPFFTNIRNIVFYFIFPLLISFLYYKLFGSKQTLFESKHNKRKSFFIIYGVIILIGILSNELVYKARRGGIYIFENNPYHILYRLYFVELNPYKNTHLNLGQSVVSKIDEKDLKNAEKKIAEYDVQNKKYPFMRYIDEKKDFIHTKLGEKLNLNLTSPPNIVFIVLESLSTIHINKDTMPYLFSFSRNHSKSIAFNNFFAVSNQTVKGQHAIFCGSYPTFNGKIATDYLKLKVKCLPHILKPLGYYIEANNGVSRNFHNKEYFFENILGFNRMRGIETFDKEKMVRAAWGASDLSSIKDMLGRIKSMKRPYLFQFMSVNYHGPYKLPPDYKKVIGNEEHLKTLEMGDKILYYLDFSLRYFFNEFSKISDYENTIFVITADHGGGKRYKKDLTSFELFKLRNKIPLIIFSPLFENLEKSLEINSFHNQFEIAPLILDLLKIKSKNHFIGLNKFLYDPNSVLKANEENSYINLKFPNIARTLGRQIVFIKDDKLLMTEGINHDYLKVDGKIPQGFSTEISKEEKSYMTKELKKAIDFWLRLYMPHLHFNRISD